MTPIATDRTEMHSMKIVLILIVALLGAGISYVRLTPVDPDTWHVDPVSAELGPTGYKTTLETDLTSPAALTEVEKIALATPRTKVLAGTVQEGRMTFVTRSLIWGFPDIATISATPNTSGSTLTFFSRPKIGDYDYGVNKRRIEGWIAQINSAE